MLGMRHQFSREINGDDRFCKVAAVRKWKISDSGSRGGAETEEAVELSRSSNLCRFMEKTTPYVSLSRTRINEWSTCNTDCFTLGDLWESFKEWSVYGAGVPLVLSDNNCVVQYYVPYLSGIQLYGDSSRQAYNYSRQPEDDSDIESYKDSSSDGSSDCDMDLIHNHLANGFTSGMDRLSMSDSHAIIQEGFSSDDSDAPNPRGRLLFQYLEHAPPYCREPLADKVIALANQFQELWTIKSSDILPESWISVAWYPIYRIPLGPTLKDLDACFLTFHRLSTLSKGVGSASGPTLRYPQGINGTPKFMLSCFGMASYKCKGPLWTPTEECEKQLITTLLQSADDWLHLLSVVHPDFRFFTAHGAFC